MARRAYMIASAAGVLMGCFGLHAARADHQPVIALPGNPQVPVIIDGMPATGALVSGDWGLYAPGRVVPEVLAPAYIPVDPVFAPFAPVRGYYPRTGHRPRYGRHEVFVPRRPLQPAPSYYRSWSSESQSGPVTDYPPYNQPIDYSREDDRAGDAQNQQDIQSQRLNRRRDAESQNQQDIPPQRMNKRRGEWGYRGAGPHPRHPHRGGHSLLPHRRGHSLLPRRGGHS